MNKTAIEWCDFTWNPLVGCAGTCSYCYARRIATTRLKHRCPQCATFTPHLHEERLWQPYHNKPGIVFVDSMSDWWSEGVGQDWRTKAFRTMDGMGDPMPAHQYVVLTKWPERISEEDLHWLGRNIWLGVSITGGTDWWRWEALAKLPGQIHKFISVEPLLGPGVGNNLFLSGRKDGYIPSLPEFVIVGRQSGPGAMPVERDWQWFIRSNCCRYHIPLFEKSGLPLQPPNRQLPLGLARVFRKGNLTESYESPSESMKKVCG